MEDCIKACIQQLKTNQYKPSAIWVSFDGEIVYIVTDDIDRSEYLYLKKKFRKQRKSKK